MLPTYKVRSLMSPWPIYSGSCNDSCLPQWPLICYCSTAAVQHAAESRWQPGRSGGWGAVGGRGQRGRTGACVVWVAGGGGRLEDGRCDCVGEGNNSSLPCQAAIYYVCMLIKATSGYGWSPGHLKTVGVVAINIKPFVHILDHH